ncbi:transporter [Virgibacillus sp. 7505]|uniref:transporter n=1 Tax=Virgibacillus sp. 7505 TaxID=2022548 RepID=UPI00336A1A5A
MMYYENDDKQEQQRQIQFPGGPGFGGPGGPGSGGSGFGGPGFGGGQGGFPFVPPPGAGGQGGGQQGQFGPPGPPPSQIPQLQPVGGSGGPSAFAIDPGGIRFCLFRYTYMQLENGQRFWYYPVFVGRTSIAGFRWRPQQFRWQYFGIDLRRVAAFSCF